MSETLSSRAELRRLRRSARRSRYEGLFEPRSLALAGLAISVAFLFQPSLALRTIMFALFMVAAVVSGKRISPLATLLVCVGIVVANLLVPVGRVLVRLGPLTITEFALLDGLGKAVTFEGLMQISKASILPGLRLPGRFGSIVASAFVYYDRIVEYRGSIRPSHLMADADELMLKVWEEDVSVTNPESRRRRSYAGLPILAGAVLAAYAALILAFVLK